MQNLATFGVVQASRQTGIGQKTIRDAIHAGNLAAIKLGQRRIRIRPEALEQWLKSLEQATKGEN